MLDAMLAAGCTAEQIVAVVKAELAEEERRQAKRRAKDNERKRRSRHADSTDVTRIPSDSAEFHGQPPCPPSFPPDPPNNPLNPPKNPSGKKVRGGRLPDDWQPTPEDRAFALPYSVDVDAEADKFRDYWRAKTGQQATKADWSATWRNWVRRAGEDAKRRPERKHDPTAPAQRREPTEAEYRTAVRKWQGGGPWPQYLGPRPDMQSTNVPKHIRQEFQI